MDAMTFARSAQTRVLIVDDEPHARKLLATMLVEGGVRCKIAACAEEALRILDKEPLAAMLLDLQMPRVRHGTSDQASCSISLAGFLDGYRS